MNTNITKIETSMINTTNENCFHPQGLKIGNRGKKRIRKRRMVSKPKRPSKSLKSLKALARAHRWVAMLTLKPAATTTEALSNIYQRFLVDLLRRELRGKGIGFLLIREFGRGTGENDSGNRSHFHIVLTREISDQAKKRIKKSFLKRSGIEKDPSRTFHYACHSREGPPKFGNYISKFIKDSVDVTNPPIHWNHKILMRRYHYSFLDNSSLVNNMQILPSLCLTGGEMESRDYASGW